jgi:TRAP-type C4-dicarboxylate transport system substrate-binding protein
MKTKLGKIKFVAGFLVSLLVFTALISTSCLASEKSVEPITLKFATFVPPTSFVGKQHNQYWIDQVEKRTNGRIKFQVFWSGSLAAFSDMLTAVQSGIADVGLYSCQYNPSHFPLWSLLDLPYNVGDDYTAAMLANLETQRNEPQLKAEFEREGVITVAPHISGQFTIGAKKCPESIRSLKGKTIRILSGGRIEWTEKLGLNPVRIAFDEIYEAINRGTIDLVGDMALDLAHIYKLYEIVKCVKLLNSGNLISAGLIMNRKVYDKIPEDIHGIFDEIASDTAVHYGKALKGLEAHIIDTWKKKYGVTFETFSPEDTRLMIEMAKETREDFFKQADAKGLDGRKVWDYYQGALKKYEAQRRVGN